MIFTQSQTPRGTVLVATVTDWRYLLALRPVAHRSRGVISHQIQPGAAISGADWLRVSALIEAAITGKDDGAVARVRIPVKLAETLQDMARESRE